MPHAQICEGCDRPAIKLTEISHPAGDGRINVCEECKEEAP